MNPASKNAWTRRQTRDVLAMKNPATELKRPFVPGPRSAYPRDKFTFSQGFEYDEACKEAWRKRLSRDAAAYQDAPASVKNDSTAVLAAYFAAIKRTWASLERANEQLAQDRILVAEAVENDWWELNDAGIGLRDDREFVFNATQGMTKWGYSVTAAHKVEVQLVTSLQQLRKELQEFQDVSMQTRWDREDRLRALELEFQKLQANAESMPLDQRFLVGKKHWDKLIKMGEQLTEDRNILFNAVVRFSPFLHKAVSLLRGDRRIMLKAVKQFWASKQASAQIGDEKREVVLQMVMQDWQLLESMTKNLRKNQELMLTAVNKDWAVLEEAANVVRDDRELIHEAMVTWGQPWRRRSVTDEELFSALTSKHAVEHLGDQRTIKFEEAFKQGVLSKKADRERKKSMRASNSESPLNSRFLSFSLQ